MSNDDLKTGENFVTQYFFKIIIKNNCFFIFFIFLQKKAWDFMVIDDHVYEKYRYLDTSYVVELDQTFHNLCFYPKTAGLKKS